MIVYEKPREFEVRCDTCPPLKAILTNFKLKPRKKYAGWQKICWLEIFSWYLNIHVIICKICLPMNNLVRGVNDFCWRFTSTRSWSNLEADYKAISHQMTDRPCEGHKTLSIPIELVSQTRYFVHDSNVIYFCTV